MVKQFTAAAVAPVPAPAPGVRVRIPLVQLHQYLTEHGLQIARRVGEAGGGWYVELVAAGTGGTEGTEGTEGTGGTEGTAGTGGTEGIPGGGGWCSGLNAGGCSEANAA